MPIIQAKQSSLKQDIPEFSTGDTLKVYQKIREGEKERVQLFEGLVIARHGRQGSDATFTVRRIASGVGVERIFPLHSPNIVKIEVSRKGSVARGKIYYVRNRQDSQPRFRKSKSK